VNPPHAATSSTTASHEARAGFTGIFLLRGESIAD
jgi:hypothetical protein